MDRRTFIGLTAATAATSLLSDTAVAQTGPKAKNVVLVHGLFADGSSWSEVIPRLQAAGLNVTSVQNPLTTLPEAVDAALRVLERQDGPTVLAGHSFSGMIVSDAGVHPNVSALVYVAARAPDAGEDYTALAKTFPAPPASAGIVFDGAVSTEDRTINPDLERFMAKRMGAKTIEVKASHVSLISQPETIANLILEAAG
jgi:pimeloyl-ACP methyl ester carboxylesterase